MMILRLEIHIDTTREDTFRDMEEAIIRLLEAALSVVTVQTVVTIPEGSRPCLSPSAIKRMNMGVPPARRS